MPKRGKLSPLAQLACRASAHGREPYVWRKPVDSATQYGDAGGHAWAHAAIWQWNAEAFAATGAGGGPPAQWLDSVWKEAGQQVPARSHVLSQVRLSHALLELRVRLLQSGASYRGVK
jgi:hypothetical protein